jgi:hypothetical protein
MSELVERALASVFVEQELIALDRAAESWTHVSMPEPPSADPEHEGCPHDCDACDKAIKAFLASERIAEARHVPMPEPTPVGTKRVGEEKLW